MVLNWGGPSHWSSTWPYSWVPLLESFATKQGFDIHPRLTLCSYEWGRCIYIYNIYIIYIYIYRQNLWISFEKFTAWHASGPLLNLSLSEGRHFHSPHSGYFLVPVAWLKQKWNFNTNQKLSRDWNFYLSTNLFRKFPPISTRNIELHFFHWWNYILISDLRHGITGEISSTTLTLDIEREF